MADGIAPFACLCTCRCTHDFTQPSCVSLLIKVKGHDEMLFFFFFSSVSLYVSHSLGEACNHVAALLFYLEDASTKGLTELPAELSKTSLPMQWNQPPKKTVAPQPLCELAFVKAAHGTHLSDADLAKRCKRAEFDPRAPGDRQVSHESVKSLLDYFQKENLQTMQRTVSLLGHARRRGATGPRATTAAGS